MTQNISDIKIMDKYCRPQSFISIQQKQTCNTSSILRAQFANVLLKTAILIHKKFKKPWNNVHTRF